MNLRAKLLVLKYATVGKGNHDGSISPQAVINRLRVRNIRPRRTNVSLVLTQSYCQTRLYLGQEHSTQWTGRAFFLPDIAQMWCAWTTCLLTSCTTTDVATAREWTSWSVACIANCNSLNGYLFNEHCCDSIHVNQSRHTYAFDYFFYFAPLC